VLVEKDSLGCLIITALSASERYSCTANSAITLDDLE